MSIKECGSVMRRIIKRLFRVRVAPQKAYDLLADDYDLQYFNIFHLVDTKVNKSLLKHTSQSKEIILDYGAGTGRNIPLLESCDSKEIIASDVSDKMLCKLNSKYPHISTLSSSKLQGGLNDRSVDLIFCNMTLGYIFDLKSLFKEWNRILKPNGEILITDMFPALNKDGLSRNFNHNGKQLIIKSRPHFKSELVKFFELYGWRIIIYEETKLDEKHKLELLDSSVFEHFSDVNLLYSFLLKKNAI